ncbi:MAG: hypothetical protein ACYDH1_12790 [Anaerolineaceae bacterium]
MHWVKSNWKSIIVPGLVLFLLGISYAVQAGKLGWYLDDWIILEAYAMGGPARLGSYTFWVGRPLISPLWLMGFWVCGVDPAKWQLWSLAWHALTSIFLWLGLRRMFPNHQLQTGLAILLFTVYPLFDQQASALTFSTHWISFALWALSFYLMILAAQYQKYWTVFVLIGLLVFSIQIYAKEFYLGLEILRPFALWVVFQNEKKRLQKTIQHETPWLIVFIGYLVWRLILMPTPPTGDRNSPIMLINLFKDPINTIFKIVSMTTQSLMEGIGGVWYQAIEPSTFVIGKNADFASWLIVISLLILVSFLLWRYGTRLSQDPISPGWYFVIFGILFFLGGILPGILKGSYFTPKVNSSDRFAMAAMPGAAILITSAVWYLFRSQRFKILFLSLLIVLSVGFQFRLANQYRHSWEKQERLFWQLLWRAPSVAENTAFLGNGALALGLGNWATSSAINLLYGNYDNPAYVPYWYVDLYRTAVEEEKDTKNFSSAHLFFQWHKPQSIVFQYEPDISLCVWVLDEEDIFNPDLDSFVPAALPLSDLSRISFERINPGSDVLKNEPSHDWWCYFYQKGDAAAQQKDWSTALSLYNRAMDVGQRAYASSEYIPFIQAAAHQGEWDLATEISLQASILTNSPAQICETWQDLQEEIPLPQEIRTHLINRFQCTNLEE